MFSKILIAGCAFAALAVHAQEGVTVVRDAETGKLRAPTAAELRAMTARDPRHQQLMQPRPRSTLRPDGTRALELGERGQVYSVVTRAPDGSIRRRCVHGSAQAEHSMQQPEEHDHGTE